jgi:hypothetical protein
MTIPRAVKMRGELAPRRWTDDLGGDDGDLARGNARAWDRTNSLPTKRLTTRFGMIEFADHGEGLPLLVAHGILGCHVDSVGTGGRGSPAIHSA